jgi:hypothetical protein
MQRGVAAYYEYNYIKRGLIFVWTGQLNVEANKVGTGCPFLTTSLSLERISVALK